MAATVIVDSHMHIYKTRELGLREKESYQIWEYGEKSDVHFCQATGTVEEAVRDMAGAGISKAVVVNLFAGALARRDAIAELPQGLDQDQRERAIEEIDSSMGDRLKEFTLWGCI